MNRTRLTLMELLIVVACSMGILAACEGTVLSPEDAIVASMRSDLQRLVTAQQAFFSANNHYASGVVSDQNNCFQAEGCVSFVPSPGNVVIFDYLAFHTLPCSRREPLMSLLKRRSPAASTEPETHPAPHLFENIAHV